MLADGQVMQESAMVLFLVWFYGLCIKTDIDEKIGSNLFLNIKQDIKDLYKVAINGIKSIKITNVPCCSTAMHGHS